MVRKIGFGLILWIIPYVLSIPLLGLRESNMAMFKSFIISIAMVVSAFVLVLYFRKVQGSFLKDSVVAAIVWLVLNLLLDVVALLPFSKQPFSQYFLEIGIEYVAFASIVIAVGYLLEKKAKAY